MKQLLFQEHVGLNTGIALLLCDFSDRQTFLSYSV